MKEVNPNKEYILLADISASMSTQDPKCGGMKRYDYMIEKFKQFIKEASDFDAHQSTTVILFGEKATRHDNVNLENIDKVLNHVYMEGFTNLHLALDEAYEVHKESKRDFKRDDKIHPGSVFIVFTDGDPTNRNAVKRNLESIIKNIDSEDEIQVILVTVGTVSRELASWLKSIHDDLEDKSINPNDYDIIHIAEIENLNFLDVIRLKDHE